MVWRTCLCLAEDATSGADDLRGEEEEEGELCERAEEGREVCEEEEEEGVELG